MYEMELFVSKYLILSRASSPGGVSHEEELGVGEGGDGRGGGRAEMGEGLGEGDGLRPRLWGDGLASDGIVEARARDDVLRGRVGSPP